MVSTMKGARHLGERERRESEGESEKELGIWERVRGREGERARHLGERVRERVRKSEASGRE